MGRSTGAWGSEDRFATLFERTYQRVHAVARRRVGESDADDLVSETFMVALRRRHEIPSDVDEALLWLYKVTINTAANKVRGDRRRAALIEHLQQGGEARMQNPTALDGTEVAALADAFLTLSEPAREILLLSVWDGLEPREIAVVLGITPGAAATRLSRARDAFRQALAEAEQDGGDERGARP